MRTNLRYRPTSAHEHTISVTGPSVRIAFDPGSMEVLQQFVAQGLRALVDGGAVYRLVAVQPGAHAGVLRALTREEERHPRRPGRGLPGRDPLVGERTGRTGRLAAPAGRTAAGSDTRHRAAAGRSENRETGRRINGESGPPPA